MTVKKGSDKNCVTGEVRRALTRDIPPALMSLVRAGGMCLVTEGVLAPNTRLELEVHFPDGTQTVKCLAEVVWTRLEHTDIKSYQEPTALTGVLFVQIALQARKNLIQYAKMNSLMSGGGEAPGA